MLGFRESLRDFFRVAIMKIEREIVGHLVEHQRRARLDRLGGLEHRRERLDIERDRFGGVLGVGNGLRDHTGDRIADETHFVGGQRRPRHVMDRRAVAVLQRHVAFEPAITGEIVRGQHGEHARHRLGGAGIDRADDAVRLAAAHHHGIGLAGAGHIVGITALAAHQRGVFGAANRLADAEFGQRKRGFGGSVVHVRAGGFRRGMLR